MKYSTLPEEAKMILKLAANQLGEKPEALHQLLLGVYRRGGMVVGTMQIAATLNVSKRSIQRWIVEQPTFAALLSVNHVGDTVAYEGELLKWYAGYKARI